MKIDHNGMIYGNPAMKDPVIIHNRLEGLEREKLRQRTLRGIVLHRPAVKKRAIKIIEDWKSDHRFGAHFLVSKFTNVYTHTDTDPKNHGH